MFRFIFYAVMLTLFARALARLWGGIIEGLTGQAPRRGGVPQVGVAMARDPVCGTFVVRDRAVVLSSGSGTHYFCSPTCRDAFRTNPHAGSAA